MKGPADTQHPSIAAAEMAEHSLTASPPRLTILLITYNHENFIERAIQGIEQQRLNEPVDIIVADDGSTDKTRLIIETRLKDHPRYSVQFLDHSGRLGTTKNYQRAFAACRTEYVAILEGDDYWTSPTKLARQLDFLENHYECPASATNYLVYDESTGRFSSRLPIGSGHLYADAPLLIKDNLIGNFSTCMYRTASLERLPPKLFSLKSYDWIVNICVAREGPIGILSAPMSVYRLHSSGVWNSMNSTAKLEELVSVIPAYNEVTDRLFIREFSSLLVSTQAQIVTASFPKPLRKIARSIAKRTICRRFAKQTLEIR